MATPSPSSTAPTALPSGCTPDTFRGLASSGNFTGCTTTFASTLFLCCARVGSTPAFANDTCGCPYNNATGPGFALGTVGAFIACAEEDNDLAGCIGAEPTTSTSNSTSAGDRFGRQNAGANAALVVLGAALLLGVIGVQ